MRRTKSLYRYQAAAWSYLGVKPYGDEAERLVTVTVLEAAETMSDPADLINRAVEALGAAATDLPAFSTLDRLVSRLRAEVHGRMYDRIAARVTAQHAAALDALLVKPPGSAVTGFNRLKQAPGPATLKTVRLWTERLEWLDDLIDPDPLLDGAAHTKLRHFAAEAAASEVSDLLDITQPGKRHTLLLALLRQARMRCRDELVEMMLRRIRRSQALAKEQLEELHEQHRATEENLIGIFGEVLETEQTQDMDAVFGRQVRDLLPGRAASPCWRSSARPCPRGTAATTFRCCDPSTPSTASCCSGCSTSWTCGRRPRTIILLDALAVVSSLRHARRDDVEGSLDLGFASPRWLAFVAKRRARPGAEHQPGPGTLDRRALEVCVFVHLADALQTGDLFIVGAETFADYRAQLLPWAECEARLPGYCAALGIPERGEDFAAALKAELATLAAAVDAGFPDNTEFSVDADGTPHLKQLASA